MSVVHIDRNALRSLKDLMEDEFPSLLAMFIEDAQMNVDRIEKGVKNHDRDMIRSAAHAIKGSASNVAALQLSALAAELENQIKLDMGDFDDYAQQLRSIKEEFELIRATLVPEAAA